MQERRGYCVIREKVFSISCQQSKWEYNSGNCFLTFMKNWYFFHWIIIITIFIISVYWNNSVTRFIPDWSKSLELLLNDTSFFGSVGKSARQCSWIIRILKNSFGQRTEGQITEEGLFKICLSTVRERISLLMSLLTFCIISIIANQQCEVKKGNRKFDQHFLFLAMYANEVKHVIYCTYVESFRSTTDNRCKIIHSYFSSITKHLCYMSSWRAKWTSRFPS